MAERATRTEAGDTTGRTVGRQERSKETRRRLIRAATRLWSKRGFDAVTVEDICSEAGVSNVAFATAK